MSQLEIKSNSLLIELGTEELPPKALRALRDAFKKEIVDGLINAQVLNTRSAQKTAPYATPRRLAVSVPHVHERQADQMIERRGPSVQAAFDKDGKPTQAVIGFAKSCGVDIDKLQKINTEKGEWLIHKSKEKGKTIAELVPSIIEQALKRLPIAKRMRWGAGSAEFVRPVHWLVILHGDNLIPATILGINSSNKTRGHRFHSKGEITLEHAQEYSNTLQNVGSIIPRFQARQDIIEQQVKSLAEQKNGYIEKDQALLDEVTGLVEYPNALMGSFDKSFLEVPQECLISSMRDHQKYFHVNDAADKLLPYFITVSNINSKNPTQVIEGNERVLRARLSDAQFFWETDLKTPLADRVASLDKVLFHIKLGSVLDKANRIKKLAGTIAKQIGGDSKLAERGAYLAKADLVSNMVGEFADLQGVMGKYYAERDGEPSVVSDCIEQHYWPKFAGDRLPKSAEAQAVSLADKLDSLVGIFSAGEIPTGDKDPYALRRAALGILRILIKREQTLTISSLVADTANVYASNQNIKIDDATQQKITDFILGRLSAYYQSKHIETSTINAVLAVKTDSPLDFHHRLEAVDKFSDLAEAADLAAANKRISNIIKKQDNDITDKVDVALLVEAAEKTLYESIETAKKSSASLFESGDYSAGLQQLAALRNPVDTFFDDVMVMSDDKAQQANRLSLLKSLQTLFLRVADISLLQK